MSNSNSDLAARIDELESRLAFQDDMIENLNEVIARQDRDLSRVMLQLNDLSARLSDIAEGGASPGNSPEHEVPPHY